MFIISDDFYLKVLKHLIKKNILKTNFNILIAAAGSADKSRFLELNFKNVTISNLDVRMKASSFKPFKWSFQDVENLSFKDNAFDFAVIHHGLHHSASPHRGLLELYRVSKKGIIVFEGIDNLLSRLGAALGFSEDYELAATFNNDLKFGGFRNTEIPNFVYRWKENEVIKTISCFEPVSKPVVKFFYGLELPFDRLRKMKNKFFYLVSIAAFPFIFILFLFFHKSIGNRFAFLILKPDLTKDLHPWLTKKNKKIEPNEIYFKNKYNRN
jgi:ubiquinone/menaquinone biosynthesis C-methylase UbiE